MAIDTGISISSRIPETGDGPTKLAAEFDEIPLHELVEAAGMRLEKRVHDNEGVIDDRKEAITALSDLQKKVEVSHSVVEQLRGLDPLKGVSNTYNSRKGVSLSNQGLVGSDYAVILPKGGTPPRTISLEIDQVATADRVQASAASSANSSTTSVITGPPGAQVTINGQTIDLGVGDSLEDLRDNINANIKDTAHVEAKVVGSGTVWRLELIPTETATSQSITISDNRTGNTLSEMKLIRNTHLPYGGPSGNLQVNGVDIPVTDDMSLWGVKNAVNAYSSSTNVVAVIDQLSAGDYRLTLQHLETGQLITVADDQGNDIMGKLNLAANSGKALTDLEARFRIDGEPSGSYLTRITNDVEDLVEGVTIKLIQPTAGGQNIKLVIDPDIDELLQRVTESAVAIEDLFKAYIDSQTAPEEGEGSEAGALKKNPIMKKLYDGLVNTLTGHVGGLGSDDYRVLADIGLKLEKTEVEGQNFFNLTTDMTKLKSAVQTSPEKIQKLLAFNYTSSNPKFRVMDSPNSLHKDVAGQDILVNVSKDGSGVLSATLTINGRGYGATINSKGKITGQANTAVEGLSLNIASSTLSALGNGQSVTSTVNMTQGLFDRLGDVFNGLLKKSTAGGEYGYMSGGDFQRAEGEAKDKIDDLKTQNTRLNERIEQAKARMQAKVDLLIEMMHKIQSMEDSLQASLDFMKFSGR